MGSEEVYYDIATRKFHEQFRSIDGLDAKAAALLIYSGLLLVFFGLSSLLVSAHFPKLLFIAVTLIILIAHAFVLRDLWLAYRLNSQWSFGAKMDEALEEKCREYTKAVMQIQIARNCIDSFDYNKDQIEKKAHHITRSMNLIGIESALIGLTAFLLILVR